jgi:hypothetical protein
MILIGRNFEVISINARGQALEELLKKEFPGVELPVEKEPKSEAVTDKSSVKPLGVVARYLACGSISLASSLMRWTSPF